MTEPNRDRRKVWWAVLASVALHLLIGLSLAAFGGSQKDLVREEPQVPQLTLMDLPDPTPPPMVPKNALVTTVDPSRKSAEAPKEKTFEANENSIAAAEKAAENNNQLPGQDGKDRPFMNLEEHENTFATGGATPQPEPSATATPDQLALLTQTPTPVPSPSETEEAIDIPTPSATPTPTPEPVKTPAPASSYRDFQQKTVIRGGINNRGRSAVNAVGTPLGRYRKMLEDAIGSRWFLYVRAKADLISIGTTKVVFEIRADGSVENLRMTENTANEAFASVALRSIQETSFPPIPEDLLTTLPNNQFRMEMSFTYFANQ